MASILPRTDWDQVKKLPDLAVLKLHRQLKKAESAILKQMRTGLLQKSRTFQQNNVNVGTGGKPQDMFYYIVPSKTVEESTLGENQGFTPRKGY
ncbi:hypothetical protein CJF30_00010862 [Rutstroemia sp. NJR-2017a BBW]|nr:hypothetical protein CJF30_00010862 [Rutstroemia sp. NJR-2017a BBW]